MTDFAPRQFTGTEFPLQEDYRQMASESDREEEAMEWCEGLIGDAFVQEEDEK